MINSFLQWFEANQHRFRLPPEIMSIDEAAVRLEILSGLTATARSRNSTFAINVYVMNPEDPVDTWDVLQEFETLPKERDDLWYCGWCEDYPKPETGPLRIYASRDELLIIHIFEPFLDWINRELVVADGVGLYRVGCDCTWAKLVRGNNDPEVQHRVHWSPVPPLP